MSIGIWEERYRPQRVSDIILPDRLKVPFQRMVADGEIQNLLFEGPPGCGKTTAAKAICNELGCDWIVVKGSMETGIDVLRGKVSNFASAMSLDNDAKHKVVIFDEADGLNVNSTQPGLRNLIDEFKETCRFIFTANYKSRLIEPLHSRLETYTFTFSGEESQKMAGEFFISCSKILTENGVEFEKAVLAKVIKRSFPDLRKILGELSRYAKTGPIDSGILASNMGAKIEGLSGLLKAKDFASIRKFFTENPDVSNEEFFAVLYKSLLLGLEPSSIPQAVLILADYQYKAAFAANYEINLTACCVQLMIDCKFK